MIGLTCGMLFLTACGGNKDSGSYDVISQKKVEEGRTVVTILVKYAFSINSFEKAVEENFRILILSRLVIILRIWGLKNTAGGWSTTI